MTPRPLDVDTVAPYLLSRGLIDEEDVFAGNVCVESVAGRNRSFKVSVSNGRGVFVKQADPATAGSSGTVGAEGAFYRRVREERSELLSSIPALLLHDERASLLAVELLPDHTTLAAHCRSGEPGFPVRTWQELGALLGHLHRTEATRGRGTVASGPGTPPWVTRLHRPAPSMLSTLSQGGLAVLGIVQASPVLVGGLRLLADEWHPDTGVHGDVRGSNVLVRETSCDEEPAWDIRLVDWESQQFGDSLWDVACALETLVRYWALSLQVAAHDPRRTAISSSELRAAGAAFWEGHIRSQGSGYSTPDATRLAAYCAARLTQSAFQAAADRDELPRTAVLYLQISENILAAPGEAAAELLALT
ncbi:phosphotransferase [Streptomyces tsukubensis]|uniref:Aminoglycoside phosphotransferase domain-containing protein n=1 Tax=Streptomyces tsukubensis TaxID=83656 RepID=A0A1V4A2Z0_9ACTN|nr:phosphotransferase [Streptomyces tsukubensis]OON73452.1 hypothetical protein B1H18_27095 [Streptomyces tsukubensis]